MNSIGEIFDNSNQLIDGIHHSRILTEKYIYGIIVYTVYQSCCEEA